MQGPHGLCAPAYHPSAAGWCSPAAPRMARGASCAAVSQPRPNDGGDLGALPQELLAAVQRLQPGVGNAAPLPRQRQRSAHHLQGGSTKLVPCRLIDTNDASRWRRVRPARVSASPGASVLAVEEVRKQAQGGDAVGRALGVDIYGVHVVRAAFWARVQLEHDAARLQASRGRRLAMLLDVRLERRPAHGPRLCR
jgi:hypothetical protein